MASSLPYKLTRQGGQARWSDLQSVGLQALAEGLRAREAAETAAKRQLRQAQDAMRRDRLAAKRAGGQPAAGAKVSASNLLFVDEVCWQVYVVCLCNQGFTSRGVTGACHSHPACVSLAFGCMQTMRDAQVKFASGSSVSHE